MTSPPARSPVMVEAPFVLRSSVAPVNPFLPSPPPCAIIRLARAQRCNGLDFGAAVQAARTPEPRADLLRALTHAREPPTLSGFVRDVFRIESVTVVTDAQPHGAVVVGELGGDRRRFRVLHRV